MREEDEKKAIHIVLYNLNNLFGKDSIIQSFPNFIRRHRKTYFLYLDNPELEKTLDKVE